MRCVARTFWSAALIAAAGFGPAPAADPADSGAADLEKSRVYIFVPKSTALGHDHGVVGRLKSGRLLLDADKDAGELVFDIRTFAADTDEARRYVGLSGSTDAGTRQQVTGNMLGGEVLDVRRYPTATFKIESSKATGKTDRSGRPLYELSGEFTLHGVTRSIKVSAVAEPRDDGTLRVRGTLPIRQTRFGMKPFSRALGTIGVADQLTIHGDFVVAGS